MGYTNAIQLQIRRFEEAAEFVHRADYDGSEKWEERADRIEQLLRSGRWDYR